MKRLEAWGFRVGCIHGGMRPGSRDEPGSRLHAEQQFREGAIQVLVATEAAGEGINLQCCHILFNYDIPWNPNRLEQRMGRIHRYGQLHDCLIFNFVATNTIEGQVLERLLDRLKEIRDALDDDAVFNVVGEVLPAVHVERVLRDFYAGKLGEGDLEDRLLKDVDESHFRAICQTALEGLASKKLNLDMLIERRARAQERRIVPETMARFLRESAADADLALKPVSALPHTFHPGRTPPRLRRYEAEADWRYANACRPLSARFHGSPHRRGEQPRMGDAGASPVRGAPTARARTWAGGACDRRLFPLPGARRARPASTSTGRGSWTASGRSSTSGSSWWNSAESVGTPALRAGRPGQSVSRPRPGRPAGRSLPCPRRRSGSTSTA